MSYAHYERLSALDASFLELEDGRVHMHVGFVALFEPGPLATGEGAVDLPRLRAGLEATLLRLPRFRERLAHVPGLGWPVWVDDERFRLDYHLRHTALPRPGTRRQLFRLAGRILSQELDRARPLWELWVVEGLEDGRFALVAKVHHALVDGVSGVEVMAAFLRSDPDPSVPAPRPWIPRPAPSAARLLADEALRRTALAGLLAGRAARALAQPGRAAAGLREGLLGLGTALAGGLRAGSATSLNPEVGPHRRIDGTVLDLDPIREVRERLGGTVNEVALAVAAGALRRRLRARGAVPEELVFRALVPVSVRRASERGALGNRISFLLAELPVGEPDPIRRLARARRELADLKRSPRTRGGELLEEIADWTLPSLFGRLTRLASRARAYHTVVTNVPGPARTVYLLGAALEECYPVAPLFSRQAVSSALLSYRGSLFWGLIADWDAVPDLHELALAVDEEMEALRKSAAATAGAPPPEGGR